MIIKSASKCPVGIAYFSTSLKTPQTAAGLGRREMSQLRTPGGVQASCAYRRTPVGRVQGCGQVCVCACVAVLYNALRSSSGMSFFIPGLNRPVCQVKNTIIVVFYVHKDPLGVTEGLRTPLIPKTTLAKTCCFPITIARVVSLGHHAFYTRPSERPSIAPSTSQSNLMAQSFTYQ